MLMRIVEVPFDGDSAAVWPVDTRTLGSVIKTNPAPNSGARIQFCPSRVMHIDFTTPLTYSRQVRFLARRGFKRCPPSYSTRRRPVFQPARMVHGLTP